MVLRHYARKHANPQVTSFVEGRLDSVTNLNEEKIAQLLGSFNPVWRESFQSKRTPQQKDAIDSVVANRHQIAHGRPVEVTLVRMKNYYAEVAGAVKLIDEQCVNVH
jgi:hypothetical protein